MRKVFIVSILLNAVLVSLAAYGLWQRNSVVPARSIARENPTSTAPTSQSAQSIQRLEPTNPPVAAVIEQTNVIQNWHQIESPDYLEYIANLRKIGCPDETIADIIISEVSELYRSRLGQLPSVPKREFKFWQTGNYDLYPRLDPALEKARRDVERERDELLRTLLGPLYATYKVPSGSAEKWMYDPFFAALPPDKRSRVFDIQDRYATAVKRIRDHRQDYLDEEDRNELRRLREVQNTELATALTPEEFLQFQARFSEEAEQVRKINLATFDATEEEFRAIVLAENQKQSGNRDEIETKLKETLGAERYAEYKRSHDWEYRRLAQLAKKQKLPKEVAQKVYDMKAEVESAMHTLHRDRQISAEERTRKLSELRATTEQAIIQALGEEGFKQFEPSAWWLRNLAPSTGVRPAAVVPRQ